MASITIGFSPPKPSISISSPSYHQSSATLFSKFPLSSSIFTSNKITLSFTHPSSPSCTLSASRWRPSLATAESLEPEIESEVDSESGSELIQFVETDDEQEPSIELAQKDEKSEIPKGADAFAVVMVGSRQYIVIPGRYIYTQRLKGANVNDKIILNKVLLVGTKTHTYIGRPVVENAAVHAVVEEQGLNKKVIVFKFKKRKNYRRNIGHRQPNTRIRITGITGYEDSPAGVPNVAA
ncbi:50S ribosomal protein L21, chloroplastic [Cinnamomum micranthum f. kanehirae]|uniref:50S ribosomal protein L21, chloroplastic n=1 Tax=Cinnamomum micranthum f. kanehirae TaxID=337451 RepID=A0A443N8K6_9MAGN|nr:50S ribosomal protein L21, chloroplastic [Cinnamomum micranthum f. kanehirae]